MSSIASAGPTGVCRAKTRLALQNRDLVGVADLAHGASLALRDALCSADVAGQLDSEPVSERGCGGQRRNRFAQRNDRVSSRLLVRRLREASAMKLFADVIGFELSSSIDLSGA